jgi:hypothetical protein
MITFDSFIKLYTGIPCDFDNQFNTQCMDLAHFYCYLVLGIEDKSVLAADYAKNVWLKFQPSWLKYFKKEANGPYNFPTRGDIVIWKGTYGHIAICADANSMTFHSFDANYPVGSYPHIQFHDYTNVLGWLKRV